MNTLLRYIEANGIKNEKTESVPASELDHVLSKFVLTLGGKTEKNKSRRQFPVFSPAYSDTQKKYPFNRSKDNEFEKSRKLTPCSETEVTCSDMNTAKETNRKLLRPQTKTKPFFFLNFELGDPNPVALQRTVWWFLYNTSVSVLENISQAIR